MHVNGKTQYAGPDRFDHVYSFARTMEEARQLAVTANSAGVTGPHGKFERGSFAVVETVHSDLGYTGPAVVGRLTGSRNVSRADVERMKRDGYLGAGWAR